MRISGTESSLLKYNVHCIGKDLNSMLIIIMPKQVEASPDGVTPTKELSRIRQSLAAKSEAIILLVSTLPIKLYLQY